MPKHEGVYAGPKGSWYFKVFVERDPLTGKSVSITRRGFASAAAASKARREYLEATPTRAIAPSGLTVNELLDMFFADAEARGRLAAKTLFDYRHYAQSYVRPWLGSKRVRDIDAEVIARWQLKLSKEGATKSARGLSPNSVRLARASLAGAFRFGVASKLLAKNPLVDVAPPAPKRSIPKHWTPEQAREFLALNEGDRLWPVWAFLLGSGLRIGELIWLEWNSVEFDRHLVRIVKFASSLGYDLVPSSGKSRDAVRTIDLDSHLTAVLRRQRKLQVEERLAASAYEDSNFVFTKPAGGSYHPQWLSKTLGAYSKECQLPRLTAHGLRHTSATLMLASGVPPKVAAERLGHADPTLFTNLYSHVTPTMQREAASKIGAALFGE